MSGIAIIIPGDFSANNLGKVTFLQDIAVTAITINANPAYEGTQATLTASYTPSGTNQQGCVWSIVNGSAYATINATTGVLTILIGANANSVTVRATSAYNSAITSDATFNVTYSETVNELTAISISGDATVNAQSSQYAVSYTPSNTNYKGVVWSITAGSTYSTIDQTGLLTILSGANANSVTIKAVSSHDTTILATKTVTVTYKETPITFADAAVKSVLVSKFDTNADGEISPSEANLVTGSDMANTSLSGIFYNNTTIVTFSELALFKNVTILPVGRSNQSLFNGCTNLTTVNLDNVTNVGNYTFNSCTKLVNLGDTRKITNWGQNNVTGASHITFGENFSTMGGLCLAKNTICKWVKILNTTSVASLTGTKLNYESTVPKIYVPDSLVDSYKAATNWSGYASYIFPLSQFATDFPTDYANNVI